MSLNTALKIIDIYAGLLCKEKTIYQKFGYSEMRGYDIIDIDNALKLQLAQKVFTTDKLDDEAIKSFDRYALQNDNAAYQFFQHFLPDEILPEIEKLDPNNNESIIKLMDLEGDYHDREQYKRYCQQETQESFLKFCIAIRQHIDFWPLVYSRLKIYWDKHDTKDKVYLYIKNKLLFHSRHLNK